MKSICKYAIVATIAFVVGIIYNTEQTKQTLRERNALREYYSSTEKFLDKIYEIDDDQYLDVFTEVDEYHDYVNAHIQVDSILK